MKVVYGYNSNRAGEAFLKDTVTKKAVLRNRLVKPLEYLYVERSEYEADFERYIAAKVAINNMDYREVNVAIKAKPVYYA